MVSSIDEDECVDCGVCKRSGVCSRDALIEPPVEWPRSVRGTFSNPLAEHKETKVPGRGTEEMKTNDVTGRFRPGFAGISIEMGRPGVGARLKDAALVASKLVQMGITLEPKNPLTWLLCPKTGECLPDVREEKVLSCIIEFIVPNSQVKQVLSLVQQVAKQVSTVISVDLVYRVEPGAEHTALQAALGVGERPYPNGKTNVGLGRPLFREEAS